MELKIELFEPGPTIDQQIAEWHSQRKQTIAGIENMLATEGFREDWHFLTLLKSKALVVYKGYVRSLVEQREKEKEKKENAPTETAMRGMDSTWTNI